MNGSSEMNTKNKQNNNIYVNFKTKIFFMVRIHETLYVFILSTLPKISIYISLIARATETTENSKGKKSDNHLNKRIEKSLITRALARTKTQKCHKETQHCFWCVPGVCECLICALRFIITKMDRSCWARKTKS